MSPPTPALSECVIRYRTSLRSHRKEALIDEVSGRPLHAAKHRAAIKWLVRGMGIEQDNPPVKKLA